MTYENALKKIHSLLTFGSRPGLDRVLTLLDRMGNPQDKLKYIHVAGTNGKGSVCAMLSSVLVEAGYKTGLFISPYITDFRERIQINNQMISKEILSSAVEKTFPLIEQLQSEGIVITEFEYVNALQFYIHSQAECDVVVLETGLGGLLDCTNVINPPLCSVLTSIGLDHTAILGNTIEKIAEQKCGILKKNSIAVTSVQNENAMRVIENTAKNLDIPLYKAENIALNIKEESLSGSIFGYDDIELKLSLAGNHQLENAKTALSAIEALRKNNLLKITDENIVKGFAKAVNPARLETLRQNPTVLLDGAHNPDGIDALQHFISKHLSDKRIICILGMLADKDIDSSIKLLAHTFDKVICVPVNNPRAISAEMLAEKCNGHFNEVTFCESPEKAFDLAVDEAKETDSVVMICGSLYLAGEIRPYVIGK
ncbi:MAG: folylpolyglutamate synthase/dihydrofolate synthase family protein [Ruminococcus sp.]|nr:folylpolyglutamate synthase/dihydrofolate synthase family protein [Ruminococcus sp.]